LYRDEYQPSHGATAFILQLEKDWMTQLLTVACLSLAAKMEETIVFNPLDLQASSIIDRRTS
jgi:hypothetical protein